VESLRIRLDVQALGCAGICARVEHASIRGDTLQARS